MKNKEPFEPHSADPLVSVVCITFNQALYIRETLEGFLCQQTEFPVEIIVHDDHSDDGTAAIVEEYQRNFPDRIRAVLQKENQYSKHRRFDIIIKSCVDLARGKYIAYCEGDDYWTDPLKLQRQVDYLEKHPECGMVYTDVSSLDVATGRFTENILGEGHVATSSDYSEFLATPGFIAPLTWVFRRELLPVYDKPYVDFTYPMALDIMAKSSVHFMKENTAVYRILPESASHTSDWGKIFRKSTGLLEIQKEFIGKYPEYLKGHSSEEIIARGYSHTIVSSLLLRKYDYFREASRAVRKSGIDRESPFLWLLVRFGRLLRTPLAALKKYKN